jgi:N-acetylglucosamine kinase-like BadF-type ATPase
MTNTMDVMLAIDGGGTRTRCLAMDRSGCVLGSGAGGASNHLLVALDVVKASLEEAINMTLAQARLKRTDVACVSAGLAGVDFDGSGAAEMERLFRELGFAHTIINGDMVIAHAGALGGCTGVLALAGTGSAVLGIDANGRRIKIGGWGPVYGDEGSAYRIAQNALTAAARAYDGCGPQTALLPAIVQALGLLDFRETVARIYIEKAEPREIASLSSMAYQLAEAGDEIARNIFLHAGDDLAENVAAALRRLSLTDGQKIVSYQGAVLTACSLVRERFSELLRQQFPGIAVVPPHFTPVHGAYLLGCGALGWPFPIAREVRSTSKISPSALFDAQFVELAHPLFAEDPAFGEAHLFARDCQAINRR